MKSVKLDEVQRTGVVAGKFVKLSCGLTVVVMLQTDLLRLSNFRGT